MIIEYVLVALIIAAAFIAFITIDYIEAGGDTLEYLIDIGMTVVLSAIWPLTLCGYAVLWGFSLFTNNKGY